MVDFVWLTMVFTWTNQLRLLVMKTLRYLSEDVMVMLLVGVGLAPRMLPPVRFDQRVFAKVMSSVFNTSGLPP